MRDHKVYFIHNYVTSTKIKLPWYGRAGLHSKWASITNLKIIYCIKILSSNLAGKIVSYSSSCQVGNSVSQYQVLSTFFYIFFIKIIND